MPVDDPIIDAYRSAFPDLFSDFADMPEALQDHLRYPEDLFRVQTNMWASYHIDDPEEFYSGNDRWDVARDPGTAGAAEGTQTTDSAGNVVSSRERSEEHTSELQSLMRISYAVFCLQTKTHKHHTILMTIMPNQTTH